MGCQSSKALGEGTGMYGDGGGTGKVIGSKIYVYKQDPAVNGAPTRITWLPCDVRDGPSNDDVEIVGMEEGFTANENGDFLFDFAIKPDAFDATHTFAVVQQVLTIYRRALRRTKLAKTLSWQWGGKEAIRVLPHAGDQMGAFYSREYKALAFFTYEDESRGTVYTCRSWDVVAHETGHAILDALKPGWYKSTNVQTAAIHEAFGDITAILTLLDQQDMCEALITECKGDLHNRNVMAQMADNFGSTIGRKFGLRNVDHGLTMKDVSAEVNALSCILTSAIYDILVGVYDASRDLNKYSPAESLFRAGKKLTSNLLLALMACPEDGATIKDVAEKMCDVEPKGAFKTIIREEFERRYVFDKEGKPKEFEGDIAVNACGTIKVATNKDMEEKLQEALKAYLPEPEEDKKGGEDEQKEQSDGEPKVNGDAGVEKENDQKDEEEIKPEQAETVKEAPKAEPEQVVNGNGSQEETGSPEVEKEQKDKKGEEAKKGDEEEAVKENGEVNGEAPENEASAAQVEVEEKKG